jgi:hypothetical protein
VKAAIATRQSRVVGRRFATPAVLAAFRGCAVVGADGFEPPTYSV